MMRKLVLVLALFFATLSARSQGVITGHVLEQDGVEPIEGAGSLRVQISSSESFPTRTSYNGTLEGGTFETPQLGTIKGAGKLTDGKTYYARARYAYRTLATGTTVQYTDYCDIRSFVYHEVVVGDVNADGEVNIADVNVVVDIILGSSTSGNRLADINQDGEINIADINALIYLLVASDAIGRIKLWHLNASYIVSLFCGL